MTIFDLTTDYNELSGEITTSVIPMYQYEYVALSPEEKIMLMPADAGFGKNSYRNQITYELSLNEVTVVPCVTEERKRYYIKDVSYSIGGIVSYNEANGRIENCSVEFKASSLDFVGSAGGIASVNKGSITNSWTSVQVTTYGVYGTFGGIAGVNDGLISSCSVSGSIYQCVENYEGYYENSVVGGIAGINRDEIKNCRVGNDYDSPLRVTIRVDYTSNNSLAPYTGPVYGISDGGRISGCEKIGYILNTGNLHTTAQKSHINSDIH